MQNQFVCKSNRLARGGRGAAPMGEGPAATSRLRNLAKCLFYMGLPCGADQCGFNSPRPTARSRGGVLEITRSRNVAAIEGVTIMSFNPPLSADRGVPEPVNGERFLVSRRGILLECTAPDRWASRTTDSC